MNEIVRKDTLAELVGYRAMALAKYQEAMEAIVAARNAANRACIGAQATFSDRDLEREFFGYGKAEDVAARSRVLLDRAMWRSLVVNTPLFSLMDVQERKKFEASLAGDPPEVSVEALALNIERLTGDADMIFKRGLVNAFKTLSRDYRSHDGFKIGGRVVLTYIVSNYGAGPFMFNSSAEDRLRDIDRVMHVLDGKPEPDYMQGLTATLRASISPIQSRPATVETPYFRARWFANGNAHLWFLRDDLVDKANKIIAEHYGMSLGASPDVAKREPTFDPNKQGLKEDFFPTPEHLAVQLIRKAQISDGMSVLEPSAGGGAIVKAIIAEHTDISLLACEQNADRFASLRLLMAGHHYEAPKDTRLLQANFLESYDGHSFDRIIMNPPFSGGQALAHLFHAWELLKPGGRLVTILPGGFGGSSQRARAKFSAFEDAYTAEQHELPAGTFQESGTMVRAGLWVFDKPMSS